MLALALTLLAAAPAHHEVIAKFECQRCHLIEGIAEPAPDKQCAGCHQQLSTAASRPGEVEAGHERYGPAFDRFIARTARCYVDVPPLWKVGRFRASWLRAYLADPHDLRPHLAESMPRLPLSSKDIEVLVKGFGAVEDRPARPVANERLAKGRALFEQKGCAACHLFGANRFAAQPKELLGFTRPARANFARAPDLRFVRERLNREVVIKQLRDPASVNPKTSMPSLGLSAPEAELLADFLLFGELGAAPEQEKPVEVTPPKSVRYEDVEARVFKRTCWHCHSNPDFADGDGGPGNTGGFGFKGGGLSFATYEEVMNGSVGPDGRYRSIFRLGITGKPVLLEVLERRVHENRRDFVRPLEAPELVAPSATLGMPLGLPAVEPDELALVEAWIAAGKPRPSTPPGTMLTPMGR